MPPVWPEPRLSNRDGPSAQDIRVLSQSTWHFTGGTGKELFDMSASTGVSAKALSELGFAARRSGADSEAMEHSLKHMQKAIGGAALGGTEAATALAQIGLSANALRGMSPDKQFEAIADGWQEFAIRQLRQRQLCISSENKARPYSR